MTESRRRRGIIGAGIGERLLKYAPILAVVLAMYQYYKDAGGFAGFMADIRGITMAKVQAGWMKLALGVVFFIAADMLARFVPGKLKYLVKAVMYYLGASQMLNFLQGMAEAPRGYERGEYFDVVTTGQIGG